MSITYLTTLGDLVATATFAATVRDQFDHGQLRIAFRDAHPLCREILSLVPGIDWIEPMPRDWPSFMLRRFPNLKPWGAFPFDVRRGHKRRIYDIVITDHMADARNLFALPNIVRLRVPQTIAPSLDARLQALGLDRSRWFAVIHYREDSYQLRPASKVRQGDPAAFQALCKRIVDQLGGQVVRVGHFGMSRMPPKKGVVDLSAERDSFLLQARAIEQARFIVAGPSGPIALAWSMHIPSVLVDAADNHGGWGPAPRWTLTHTVTMADGQPLRNRALQESGLLCSSAISRKIKEGQECRLTKATAQELFQAADKLMSITTDTNGWRQHLELTRVRPNRIQWPISQAEDKGENMNFLDI